MKNFIRIFTFMLTVSIIFTACNKDTSLTEVEKNIDPTEQKILDFKAKMQNPNKSDETMSIEDAVWYIEAALNYSYCIVPQEEVGDGLEFDTSNDSISFSVNVTNNTVSIQEATTAYNQMENEIANLLAEIEYNVKFMYLIDVEYGEGNTFGVKYTIKYKEGSDKYFWDISQDWYPVGWNDSEMNYHYGGNCSGTITNQDLITDITKWISRNRAVYGNVYYTDLDWEGIFYSYAPWEIDAYSGCSWCYNIYNGYDNIELYTSIEHIWSVGSPGGNALAHIECVTAARGNYYAVETNQGLDYIEDYMIASNRHVVKWTIYSDFVCRVHGGPDDENEWWTKHRMYVHSAIPHLKEENQN